MEHFQNPLKIKPSTIIARFLITVALFMISGGFLLDTPQQIINGLVDIVTSKDVLISDYFVVGGIGASLVNAGVMLLIVIFITHRLGLSYNGMTIAAIMIVGAFSLFGKNPINIIPILVGNRLYAIIQKERWAKYIYIGLFSTCLAPFVSELVYALPFSNIINIILACIVGISLGFFIPPIAAHTITIHFGYNLYNVGFAAGFIALIAVAILRGLGILISPVSLWSKGIDYRLVVGLYLFYLVMAIYGFAMSEKNISRYLRIHRHPGRAIADFIIMDGVGPTFINMAVVGSLALSYIIAIGGDLNGPTLGAIMTVTGFAAFGMHVKNCVPITIGVVLGSLLMSFSITDPAIQLAAIFGMGLAPLAGQFGWLYGIISGVIHCAVVTGIGVVYGGLNLYNNGFSAGIVAMVMIPIIESFRKEQ